MTESEKYRILTGFLANPQKAFHPAVAADAWSALKELRGQSVDLTRTGAPRHDIRGAASAQLCARIHAHASKIGRTRPDPLILRPSTGGDAA